VSTRPKRQILVVTTAALLAGIGRTVPAAEPSGGAPGMVWERVGARSGQALVLIPALGLKANYWDRVYKNLESAHPIYLGTLAGSAGTPPTTRPYFPRYIEAVRTLVEDEKLERPILFGHLLGAHIALRFAAEHPDLVGGVVAAPVIMVKPAPEDRERVAEETFRQYYDISPDMWVPDLRIRIRKAVGDIELVNWLTEMMVQSDQATYAGSVSEMIGDQIEEALPKIKVPVLMLAPFLLPYSLKDEEGRMPSTGELISLQRDELRFGWPGIARCDFETIKDSSIFMMLDQPDRTTRAIKRYLRKLKDSDSRWETSVIPPEELARLRGAAREKQGASR